MSEIQSVLFHRDYWTEKQAHNWLVDHRIYPMKHADLSKNYIHYRIQSPKKFHRYITKPIHGNIKLVIGFPIYKY